jgi:hypothetical protein
MSLLSICQTVMGEIGLPKPPTIVGNLDPFAIQLLALANRAGKELAEDADAAGYWQMLRKQYTFQTTGVGPYTCTIIPGSTVLGSLSSTVGIQLGWNVYATGLVNDTLVVAPGIVGSTVAISQAPTASTLLTGQSVVFAQEAYPLPADLAYLIVQTEWDRNFRWQLLGPLDAQEWQTIKSGISPVGPRMRFRIMQGMFYINPVGSSSSLFTDTIAFEYVSNAWVAAVSAPTMGVQTVFLEDTDVSLLPEDLLTLSLKWRFLQAKGLDWDVYYKEYNGKKEKATGRSASARNLPLNSRSRTGVNLLGWGNMPDTNFGT